MGSTGAQGFAELVATGEVSLATSLEWHLVANHYPPLSRTFIPVAVAAIEAGNDEDWERDIPLPPHVEARDGRRAVTAAELIDALHLTDFITVEA